MGRTVPQPTKPQLALYAAFAIAVLLIGSRFLRDDGMGAGGDPGAATPAALDGSGGGVPDGTSAAAAGPSGSAGLELPAGAEGAGAASGEGAGAAAGGERAGGELPGAEAGALVIDVKGAVRRPGVYRLAAGDRAIDAVRRAGGMTGRADRLGVNLAARLTDGGEVVVPRRGEGGLGGTVGGVPSGSGGGAAGGSTVSGTGAAGAAGAPLQLDLNTATAQELEELDGVGPATAAKIVAYRELHGGFRSIEELDEVSGIGEAKLAAIRAQLGR